MSGLGDLLSEVVVQGAKQSLTSGLSHALSGAIASSVANAAGGGGLSGLKFSDPNLQASVDKANQSYQQSQGAQQPPSSQGAGAEVAPVTVTAPVGGVPVPAGALGQVIGGAASNAIAGGAGNDQIASAPDQGQPQQDQSAAPALANIAPNTLEGVTVTPGVGRGIGNNLLPALTVGAGGALVAAPLLFGGNAPDLQPPGPQDVAFGEPVQTNVEGMTPTQEMLAAAGLGAGAGALAAGGGSNGLAGLNGKDLLGAGLLGAGILGAGGGGGGAGGAAGDALKGLADRSSALADRLGGIATSGMSGDIGGRGLNSIARMVRKAQAAVRQRYSAMGMSGSTAEMQDLQAAADAGTDLQFKVGQEMAQTGLNAIAALTGQSASIYTSLLNAATAKDTAIGNALANFAGALVK